MNAVPIVNGISCKSCPFHHAALGPQGAQYFCRRNPPVAAPVVVMTPQGPKIISWQSSFPPVLPDWVCGEHPRLKAGAAADLGAPAGNC